MLLFFFNDFGDTLMKGKLSTNYLNKDKRRVMGTVIECTKCDIFNFLHDMYNGDNLKNKPVMSLINKKDKRIIRNVFKKYMDVSLFDKINKINKSKLNRTWTIKKIPFLSDSVKTPKQ